MSNPAEIVFRFVAEFLYEVVGRFPLRVARRVSDFFAKKFARAKRLLFRRGNAKTRLRERGDAGEKFAAEFLKKECGMKILCRNFRAGRDELDIAARDGETLVFVEVKTRAETDAHGAVYAVDARKRAALKRAADAYLRELRERPRAVRLDVVEVYVGVGENGEETMRAAHHRALPWRERRRRN